MKKSIKKENQEKREKVFQTASAQEKQPLGKRAGHLMRTAVEKVKQCWQRCRHIVREHRAHHFPESDRRMGQLFLFILGMAAMTASLLREKTRIRHKRAVSRGGRRSGAEYRKSNPVAFLTIAGGVAAAVLFCSFYTLGTTVTYQGNVIATTTSPLAVQSACSSLEKVTKETLGNNYSINTDQLKYTSKLMLRKDVVDQAAFEEDLSAQIGKVTYGYALYIDGEMIGATPYKGALEELLQQLKEDVTDE